MTGVKFSQKAINVGGGTIFATGNTWKASTQGTDARGLYPVNSVLSRLSQNASGQNFQLPTGKNFLILFQTPIETARPRMPLRLARAAFSGHPGTNGAVEFQVIPQ